MTVQARHLEELRARIEKRGLAPEKRMRLKEEIGLMNERTGRLAVSFR
jgi:hypothetical protein